MITLQTLLIGVTILYALQTVGMLLFMVLVHFYEAHKLAAWNAKMQRYTKKD